MDFVWAPLTKAEFEALTSARRVLERVYRSGLGPALYFLVEMWSYRMYFPRRRYMGTRRPEFTRDGVFVTVTAVLWISGLAAAASATGQSSWALVGCGFVVCVHHTHTAIKWHDDKTAWGKAAPFVSTTVHLTFPLRIGALLHHIMEHTAHHVDMSIPLYRLEGAQKMLVATLPGRIVVQAFSWRWYRETARKCKLYDFERQCWTDFEGRPTSDFKPVLG